MAHFDTNRSVFSSFVPKLPPAIKKFFNDNFVFKMVQLQKWVCLPLKLSNNYILCGIEIKKEFFCWFLPYS